MNEVVIKPYTSIGDYTLGATRIDIIKKYGKSLSSLEDNIMNSITELREAKELVYNKIHRSYVLDSVRCLKDTSPIIGDVNIFESGPDGLKAMDCDFIEGSSYITFRGLGVTLGGFGKKKIPEKRILIAFRRESLGKFEFFARS